MNKKQLLITIFIVLIFALSACQPGIKSTPTVTPDITQTIGEKGSPMPTNTATLTPVPVITLDISKLNKLQIRFLHPWTGETGKMITRMIDQFNQTNEYGVFVIEMAPGSTGLVQDKFRELMLNNLTPEVLVASASSLMRVDALYGNVVDLNIYVNSEKYGLAKLEQSDFLPAFWNESLNSGKRFGVPAQRTSEMLFYNVTWAKELGYKSPPSTWGEFRQQSCAANASMQKDSDPINDGLGGWIINTAPMTTLSWLHTFGSDPTGMAAIQITSDKSLEAFTQLLRLQTDTCAWVSRLPQPYDYFTNRQALFYSGSMEDLRTQEKNNARLESKDEWTVISYPSESGPSFLLTEGLDYGITTSTPEKQLAAWLFVKWLSAPEQQAWILRTSGMLPLSEKVKVLGLDITEDYPKWQSGVTLMKLNQSLPASQELDLAKMVLEDGAWALYRAGTSPESIPALLTQIDDTIAELAAYRQ